MCKTRIRILEAESVTFVAEMTDTLIWALKT